MLDIRRFHDEKLIYTTNPDSRFTLESFQPSTISGAVELYESQCAPCY